MGMSSIKSRRSSEADLAAVAREQLGLVTRFQAIDAGWTAAMIRTRLADGRWETLAPDVYLSSGAPRTWEARVLAVCLATGGVASHRTAARLHGVPGFGTNRIEVTVARDGRRSNVEVPGAVVHRLADVAYAQVERIGGVPTTSPARVAVDLGAVVPRWRYEQAVDDLIDRGLLTWESALRALLVHARRGRAGVGSLRTLIEQRWGTAAPHPVRERVFLRILEARGLPPPAARHVVAVEGGAARAVAFAYPDQRVAITLTGAIVADEAAGDTPVGSGRADAGRADVGRADAGRADVGRADAGRADVDRADAGRAGAGRAPWPLPEGWTVLAFTWWALLDDPGAVVTAIRAVLR